MAKASFKRRTTWLLSMVACGAFLLMAVQAYRVSAETLLAQLLVLLLVLALVLVAAALMLLPIALWRYWRKRREQ